MDHGRTLGLSSGNKSIKHNCCNYKKINVPKLGVNSFSGNKSVKQNSCNQNYKKIKENVDKLNLLVKRGDMRNRSSVQ